MSEPEPPEKQTVRRTDELLKKSRRLIDELEFILERLHRRSPPKPKRKNQTSGNQGADAARPD
jgi:hypothetical protein